MFTVKYKSDKNLYTRVVECVSFNFAEYSPQQGLEVMESRNLSARPIAVVHMNLLCIEEEFFVYPGDTCYIENSAGKTTVILR